MKTSVLVPYRFADSHRERIWKWLERRWAELAADAELVVQEAPPGADPSEFNHPRAINQAAERARGDIFIVADADTAFALDFIERACAEVAAGASWVLPRFYDQLDRPSTMALLDRPPTVAIAGYDRDWQGDGVSWSGLVVVPREGFEMVGGYDERWERWGGDDVAFACSMNTLWGEVVRLPGAAMHLWHSREHLDAQPEDQHKLMYRYLEASGNPEAIREVQAR